ncbi:MAG: TM1812 family CRISPR-associated protein [Nitrososphaerota archaeon]
MKNKDSVIILSVWGYPPQWTKYKYTVEIDHPAHRDLGKSTCISCCTTITLAYHLAKKYKVKTVVFGVDTVIDPSATKDIRYKALSSYKNWLKKLLDQDNCSCCNEISRPSIDISVLPGIGHYYGWHFKASVDNAFVQAFRKIFAELSRTNYSWVFLDLSHGLNYLLTAVLYATVANAVLFNLENRLMIMNSEPARDNSKRCIVTREKYIQREFSKSLNMLDVSRLQVAVNLVRNLIALKYFQPIQLREILKELEEKSSQIIPELEELEKALPFFKLLSNTIVGPTFTNSYTIDNNSREEPLRTALCREHQGLQDRDVAEEFRPRKNDSSKTVEYDSTSVFSVLPIALRKIVSDVCEKLIANEGDRYLIKYLDNIGKYYRRSGSIHSNLIVKRTKEELGKVVEFVVKNRNFLESCYNSDLVLARDTKIEISEVLFRAVSSIPWNTLNEITRDIGSEKDDCITLACRLDIATTKTNLNKERQEIYSSSVDSNIDRFLRNMCAHAGFEYTSIRKIVIDVEKKDLVKIVYDKDILFKILKHGKIIELKR